MADQIVFNAEQMKVVTAGERVSTIHWGVRSVEKKYASILESLEGMVTHEEKSTLQIGRQQMKTNLS